MRSMESGLLAFLGISAVVIATPGPDTALVIRNTLAGGRRGGFFTGLGISTGLMIWTTTAAAGLTAILVASEPVFAAIRVAGGLYLVYLGAHALWAAWRPETEPELDVSAPPVRRALSPAAAYRQGLLTNLGNPKILVFFTSLLPQFVPAGANPFLALMALGLLFSTLGLLWLGGYTLLVARATDLFRRGGFRRVMDAVSGTILVLFGARLATE
jgi:threonine/homoserine/homoserine lactone efflux protein